MATVEMQRVWADVETSFRELNETEPSDAIDRANRHKLTQLMERIRGMNELVQIKEEEILHAQMFYEFPGSITVNQVFTAKAAMDIVRGTPWVDVQDQPGRSLTYLYMDTSDGKRWKVFFDERGYIQY